MATAAGGRFNGIGISYNAAMPDHYNPVPFEAHVELLQLFITHRTAIVDAIQGLLSAQQKSLRFQQDLNQLGRLFEDCFFSQPGVPREKSVLRGQLQQSHWADGFKPRDMPGIPNEMFDPADLTARAFNVWNHTRWPGRNGRIRYAQSLFNLYVVRCLTLLEMRLADAGPAGAGERVALLQSLLDALWKSSPPDLPRLVRDVRWLVPVAQSPTTDDLGSYFEVARKIEACLPEADRFEIHKASVLMAGGHLRSQLRHFTMQGRTLDEESLTLSTRCSNALDCAMTIQHLVPILAAYEQAIRSGVADQRRNLAGIILQGLSTDPELYINRLDLLGAYSMVQHLFTADDNSRVTLSPAGLRHVALVKQYVALMRKLQTQLLEDCPQFRPVSGRYSPYGVMFGFSSNILEHMTLKSLQPEAQARFSLEDVFAHHGEDEQRLAWISGWRRLPHVPPEILKLYEYPQQFAAEVFQRMETALRRHAADAHAHPRTGKLHLNRTDVERLPRQFVLSTDPAMVEAGDAGPCQLPRLLADRQEGMFLLSYQTSHGWVAISKDVLTAVLGAGLDASIQGLPEPAMQSLCVMYPDLLGAA